MYSCFIYQRKWCSSCVFYGASEQIFHFHFFSSDQNLYDQPWLSVCTKLGEVVGVCAVLLWLCAAAVSQSVSSSEEWWDLTAGSAVIRKTRRRDTLDRWQLITTEGHTGRQTNGKQPWRRGRRNGNISLPVFYWPKFRCEVLDWKTGTHWSLSRVFKGVPLTTRATILALIPGSAYVNGV